MAETVQNIEEHPFLAGEAVQRTSNGAARLIGTECRDCRTRVFPPVHVCHECMSENVSETELSTEGTLYSWSVVHVAPKGWHVPYIAGYVDMPEGVRVFAHIVEADAETIKMDMRVRLTTAVLGEADGEPFESYAFRPARD